MSVTVSQHEAAHAVLAEKLGFHVIEVAINDDDSGSVEIEDVEIHSRDRAIVYLAAHAAEYVADPDAGFPLDCECGDCKAAKHLLAFSAEEIERGIAPGTVKEIEPDAFQAVAFDAVQLVLENADEIERVALTLGN